ncbi:cell division protein ZapA [Novosphingobium olei]|uniref:Cell division protein ZapA n=1 Tax=Novosphingobium olei TaxID=2728851 RepID=A0A7Y0BN60_9SPHN|nr:cell division protein ZapA [Novosphingobium olei]NML93467.1 cell division protein ZapA [Novosphingobium olei]BEV00124.1 cell division protein ZapA [Novosphingobium olei]
MSNVTLTIGGRNFTVSATDGEESHIEMLGRMIDERARRIGAQNQSEPRMLLFAALVMADELHEAHKAAPPPAAEPLPPAGPSPEVLARIDTIAARVEKLAMHLEHVGPAS